MVVFTQSGYMHSYTKALRLRLLFRRKFMEYLRQAVEVGTVAFVSIPPFQQNIVAEEQKHLIVIIRVVLTNLNSHDSQSLRRISGFWKTMPCFDVP